MRLLYDSEGDVLDIIFDERLHRAEKRAYELRLGVVLYVTVDSMKPVQLTVVNYRRLTELAVVPFDRWKRLKAVDRKKILPVINSPTVSAFLRLDPQTGYGCLLKPDTMEMFSVAA
jgi:hypothetical protein